jgi:hypothetical protein
VSLRYLEQFQQDGNHGWLWTDALCINQADLAEKSQQVKLMGEIYKVAVEVVVWLGKEEVTDESAVALLGILYDAFGLPKFLEDMSTSMNEHPAAAYVPKCTDERWLHVRGILLRP